MWAMAQNRVDLCEEAALTRRSGVQKSRDSWVVQDDRIDTSKKLVLHRTAQRSIAAQRLPKHGNVEVPIRIVELQLKFSWRRPHLQLDPTAPGSRGLFTPVIGYRKGDYRCGVRVLWPLLKQACPVHDPGVLVFVEKPTHD